MQSILSYLRRTIDNYNMIEEGDKIAVGLSGGKDSFTLLMGLKALQRFYPKKFDFAKITPNELDIVVNIINNRPRKCLRYKTPAEVLAAT